MVLSGGTRLGPYEIVTRIGSGGFGEVFKAWDSRLNRPVAIKVLAETYSRNLQVRQRFETEAKAIAALNHRWLAYTSNEAGFVMVQDTESVPPSQINVVLSFFDELRRLAAGGSAR
jgi:serine/threonine protein kinase